ncbi:hypothetical protein Tco_1262200 [Tanacetum coccineum]
MVSYKDDLYKLFLMQVIDAPTIPISDEENLGDPIDIRVDIIHPEPVTVITFLTAAVEELTGLRFRVDITEADNASLRARIKTTEAIEKITRNHERQVRNKTEQQLAAVQEKERIKPLRVRALVMTIGLDLPKQILNAQTEAQKPENLKHEDVGATSRVEQGSQYISCIQLEEVLCRRTLVVPLDGLHIDDKLHFVEEQVEVMDREVKRLKQSRIPSVKVRWNSRRGLEFTWERKDQFRKKYPHLFTEIAPSSSAVS